MGDRTYLKMDIASIDEKKADEIMGGVNSFFSRYEEQDDPAILELFEEDANYGYYCEREEWAKAGLIFRGSHNEGGDYGAQLFCAIDGVHYCVDAGHNSSNPMCPIDRETGNPMKAELQAIWDYLEAMEKVEKYFEQRRKETK